MSRFARRPVRPVTGNVEGETEGGIGQSQRVQHVSQALAPHESSDVQQPNAGDVAHAVDSGRERFDRGLAHDLEAAEPNLAEQVADVRRDTQHAGRVLVGPSEQTIAAEPPGVEPAEADVPG